MRVGLPVTVDPFPARAGGRAATLRRHGGRRVTDAPAGRAAESTWSRLRRRKVVQWGLVYVASAWGFLQGLEYVSEIFHWPEQLRQVSFLALLTGLPIVLVLALVPRRPRSTTHHDARRPLLCRALRGSGHGLFRKWRAIEIDLQRLDFSIAHLEELCDVTRERRCAVRRLKLVARQRAPSIALDE